MKTTHFFCSLFVSLACLVGFTACNNSNDEGDDDMILWDFAPIVLYIEVQDAQGNDLLNPETPGCIAQQGIKAIYNGKTYEKDIPVVQTRDYLARLYGLQTIKSKAGKYVLTFGEFNGDDTFDNEQVTIDWNDGTQDVITFSSKLTWKSEKEPAINRKFYLNGKDTGLEHGSFIIIK